MSFDNTIKTAATEPFMIDIWVITYRLSPKRLHFSSISSIMMISFSSKTRTLASEILRYDWWDAIGISTLGAFENLLSLSIRLSFFLDFTHYDSHAYYSFADWYLKQYRRYFAVLDIIFQRHISPEGQLYRRDWKLSFLCLIEVEYNTRNIHAGRRRQRARCACYFSTLPPMPSRNTHISR